MRSLVYGVRDSLHRPTESGRVTYAGFMCRGLPFDATGPVLDDTESHLLRSSHSRGTSAHMASDTLPSGAREKVALKKGFGLMVRRKSSVPSYIFCTEPEVASHS